MALNPINKASIQEGKICSWIEQLCRWGLSMFGRHSRDLFYLTALLGAWKQCHLSGLCSHHWTLGGLKSLCYFSALSQLNPPLEREHPHTVLSYECLMHNLYLNFCQPKNPPHSRLCTNPSWGQNSTALEFVWVICDTGDHAQNHLQIL